MKMKLSVTFSKLIKSFSFFSLGVFLIAALISYDVADPSLNHATSVPAKNIAGILGAYFADFFWQIFGLGSLILVVIPFSWSYVIYKKARLSFWGLRLVFALIAAISFALLLSDVNFTTAFFKNSGGAAGLILKSLLNQISSEEVVQISALFIFLISFYYALALNISEWGAMTSSLNNGLSACTEGIVNKIPKIDFSSKFKKEEQPKITNKTRQAPKLIQSIEPINEKEEFIEPKKIKIPLEREPQIRVARSEEFNLPSTELLQSHPVNKEVSFHNRSQIKQNTEELRQVLNDFGVQGEILGAALGPVVTLYELEPAAGTKSSRIIGLADDISRSMRAISARIAVIPGRNAIGIELPNKQREMVYLRELLESDEYQNKDYDLPMILGKDISGKVIVADLARMPHLLVAGTTGSGKSVAINTMILSLLYAMTPEQCRFIMIDPKMLELSVYDGIPHLLTNVVTEPGKAVVALKWVVKEMETRYRLMSNLGVRNIHNYNERIKIALANGEVIQRTVQTGFDPETGRPIIEQVPLEMKNLPFIVVIVDEMADLMIVAGKEIEGSIQRLAQMARAAGIHIIMATQRPSVDVITGVIKANFPTRISFQVTSKIDSRTILGEQGAEQLLGKGDMLYMAGGSRLTRIHGPFVADSEVEKIVLYLKSQAQPEYMNDITADDSSYGGNNSMGNGNESDELYRQAVEIVRLEGKASTSFIQRCLKIGYNRAANIMEQMEKDGLVGKPNHVGKREILM